MAEFAQIGDGAARPEIRTARLRLVAYDAELARLQLQDRAAFFAALGAKVEPAWPPELHDPAIPQLTLERLSAGADMAGWDAWAFLMPWPMDGADRPVGVGGFHGPPDADGVVEIGYSMLPSFREQGLATEAVQGLVDWACAHAGVRAIRAETLAHLLASRRVLEKSGFSAAGERTSEDGAVIADYVRQCAA